MTRMMAKRSRIRCRACGHLVTAGLNLCPYCGHQPARLRTRWRVTVLSVLLGVGLGLLAFPFAPHPQPETIASVTTQTPTAQTPRPVAVARPTFTPTATPTPLPTATATATATSAPTATATNTAVKVAQTAPTATSTVTATPKPTVEPPKLVEPKDQKEFGGDDAEIIFQWEGILLEGQQFAVNVRYIGRNDETKTVGTWTREARWKVSKPRQAFTDISLTLRALRWDVTVIDASGNAVSPPSESRIFYWR
ncbi:MAG: zinc ribbon domain-containing protein [Chloroflexota bacterium]